MTEKAKESNHFDPENYPALMEFLPAYLHEDFGAEYGSVERAFAAIVSDANGDQIRNVREEWTTLRQAFSGRAIPDSCPAALQADLSADPDVHRSV